MSLLDYFFKKAESKTVIQKLNIEPSNGFGLFGGDAYANDIYRSAIDAISKQIGKLKGSHIINSNNKKHSGDCALNTLLQCRPNPLLSAYDFLYLLSTHLFLHNTSYTLIQRNGRNITGFYPIMVSSAEFLTDASNTLYARFNVDGKQYVFPFSDLIIIKRHQNSSLYKGDSNMALNPALQLAETQNDGIINGIKSSASIRGILKYNGMLNSEDLVKYKNRFIEEYLSNENTIIALNSNSDYIPLNSNPILLDAEQSNQVKTKIFNYLGINENIINGSYDENTFQAFYKSTIEPIAIQLSQEFTAKVFTPRERQFGNSIVFESDHLNFMNNSTKVNYIKELMVLGLLSTNEARAIMNLEPIENDRFLQTLNVANTAIVDNYQLKENNRGLDNERV